MMNSIKKHFVIKSKNLPEGDNYHQLNRVNTED